MSLPTSPNSHSLPHCAMCHEVVTSHEVVTKNPRMLPCQHSFCFTCLQEWNQGQPGDPATWGQTMTCPICRQVTPHLDSRESPLPPDVYNLHKLPELVRHPGPSESHLCVVCSDDSAQFKAECYCQTCQDYMCEPCGETHQNTAIFSGHEVVRLVREHTCKRNVCKKHPTKMQDYYCELCVVLVCSACVTGQHREHPISNILKSIDDSSKKVKQLLMRLESQPHQGPLSPERGEQLCKDLMKDIGTATAESEAEIKQHTNAIIQNIQRQENEMLRNLHAHKDSLVGILTGKCQQDFYELLQQSQTHLNPLEVLKGYSLLCGEIELALKSQPKSCLEILTGLAFAYDFTPGGLVSIGYLTQGFLKDRGHSASRNSSFNTDHNAARPMQVMLQRKSASFPGLDKHPTISDPPPIPPRQRSTSLKKFNRRPVPPCPPLTMPDDFTASVVSTV